MSNRYTINNEFSAGGAKVLVLDRNREISRNEDLIFLMDGTKYPYRLTHNEKWIIVESGETFKEKQIEL